MNIKNGNFNGNFNFNFNNSKLGEKVKIGAESCLLLAIAIVLDMVIEKFVLRFYRTEQPCHWGGCNLLLPECVTRMKSVPAGISHSLRSEIFILWKFHIHYQKIRKKRSLK
ncbi:hypothetical protein CRP01_09590 [Flavilitoribacter nigricans DSM 23189 = NBRC 102662]|uniref:Uncharacterized protein n=1 Tax=Flavilitoribacter nigricans (strain ATCC 23147 / DSM 23189 / NBRC 102662 / NCIMB 1420 / SS-2) TaxID=1122177 RepID=A0A2D0NDJ9_FLAN2|nr:hypothetical protein CRP01_09590 [Flavilitoribacter nigricans DSM 23189 = NBRC 102662]